MNWYPQALHKTLWDASYLAGDERRSTETGDTATVTGPQATAADEEYLTKFFVNRLRAAASASQISLSIWPHSRALEGGYKPKDPKKKGRKPSGADLQFAIELANGRWVDLLLQAKRLFRTGKMGEHRYKYWKAKQNQDLIAYASKHAQTPGMLLYNLDEPPFKHPLRSKQKYSQPPERPLCTAFEGCDGANRYESRSFLKTLLNADVVNGSPTSVSLIFDSSQLGRNAPSPDDATFRKSHVPLEHLAHIGRELAFPSGSGSETKTESASSLGIGTLPSAPSWARAIMRGEDQNDEPDEFPIRYSVVMAREAAVESENTLYY